MCGGVYCFSFQPHTVDRKCAMFTRLLRISIIQGCSSIRQGEARREGSFSRLQRVSQTSKSLYRSSDSQRTDDRKIEGNRVHTNTQ